MYVPLNGKLSKEWEPRLHSPQASHSQPTATEANAMNGNKIITCDVDYRLCTTTRSVVRYNLPVCVLLLLLSSFVFFFISRSLSVFVCAFICACQLYYAYVGKKGAIMDQLRLMGFCTGECSWCACVLVCLCMRWKLNGELHLLNCPTGFDNIVVNGEDVNSPKENRAIRGPWENGVVNGEQRERKHQR